MKFRASRGMTLIDVIVGAFIMLVVFLALFGAFRISIELVFSTKAKIGGVAILTERMENIRSLSYASVGTVGGIPAGNLPQLEQVNLNGIPYTVSTLVQYEDAPDDGLDALDSNGITADYKVVKVEVFWNVKESSRSTFAVSRIAPVGIESLAGGGTLRINVFDAAAAPIQGADVRVVNNTTTTTIDTTVQSDVNGRATFPGAPAASTYEITVSRDGYSTAGTYDVSSENPNPSPAHVSVVESLTTTLGVAIDVLGEIRTTTWQAQGPGSFEDTFVDQSKLLSTTSVAVTGGALTLFENPSTGYPSDGNGFSQAIAPSLLANWSQVTFSPVTPTNTSLALRLYYWDGSVFTLVPDADLPNNSTGFSTSPIDISSLSTATYGTLQLGAFLSTLDASSTPELSDWNLSYVAGPTPLPNVPIDIRGNKTIGTDEGGGPVYKYSTSATSTSFSEWNFTNMEWDTYTVTPSVNSLYDLAERCPNTVTLTPGATLNLALWFENNTAHSLRVIAESGGSVVSGATISISGPQNDNKTATACGQAFFGGITSGTYSLTVSADGFQPHNENVDVLGDTDVVVNLTAL